MSDKKPNILFFFTDDQRFDTIHALGQEQLVTTNMDRLVANGTSFTHACIPGGNHEAVCMPSRAMLHTGRTLFHLQGAGEGIPAEHLLLGEVLHQAGYRCFGTGKWHNGSPSYARSFSDGAEIFFGGMEDHWNVPACDFDPSGRYERKPLCDNAWSSNELSWRQCDHIRAGKHSSELFAEASIDFLRGYTSEQPFFLYISFMAPHDPRTMPREYLEMYPPGKIELPPNLLPRHPFNMGKMQVRDELLAPWPRTPELIRRHIAEYYAMISHLDAQIGRVVVELDRLGLTENTIVLLAGDNGLAVGQHGLMGKQNNYEHSVRVPLILSGPGVPRGEKRDAFVYLLDIYPTLCELVGIEIPESVEGKSLVPALKDPEQKIRKSLFFAYEEFQRSVRTRRFKLIEYVVRGRRHSQLFDLDSDPWETQNLVASVDHRQTLQQLQEELICWSEEWDDRQSPWGRIFWEGYKK